MGSPLRIIYMDSDRLGVEVISRQLQTFPDAFDITLVATAEALKEQLQDGKVDMVFLRNTSDNKDAEEVKKLAGADQGTVPFILVSSSRQFWPVTGSATNSSIKHLDKMKIEIEQFTEVNAAKERTGLNAGISGQAEPGVGDHDLSPDRGCAELYCDDRLKVLDANDGFFRMSGLDSEKFTGSSLLEWVKPGHKEELKRVLQMILSKGNTSYQIGFAATDKEGSDLWLECRVSNVVNKETHGLHFNLRDGTARKKFENELHVTQSVLLSIINNTQIAYVLIDPEFKIITFNEQAELRFRRQFGRGPVSDTRIFDYLPEERKPAMRALYTSALAGNRLNYEVSFKEESGSTSWYNVNVFPVYDRSAEIMGLVLATEDITARKQIEKGKELVTRNVIWHNKNLEQIAYIISHNLRSPISNINSLADLLHERSSLSEEDYDQCVRGLKTAASQINNTVVDLNEILKKRSAINERKEQVRFSEVLSEIVLILGGLIKESGVLIESDFQVPGLVCNRGYMHSIFLNLISNSIKYRRKNVQCVVRVSSESKDNNLYLVFRDNGSGIDLGAYSEKIFGLYEKFNHELEGRGMGLYMVKTQTELMGGQVSLESKTGEGSVFTLRFPLS